tara:strand:- start:255 stop:779 length:525 start_codon:yes stop_codon:yes gene_type:complete
MTTAIEKRRLESEMSQQMPALRRYALLLTGTDDKADDLVQDCMERALRKAGLFVPGTNLRAWMLTMMRNIFINQKRRERLATRYVETTARYEARQEPSSQVDHVLVREALALMSRLSEDEREAVRMVAIEEKEHAEVAALAQVKVGTLKSRVSRGRAKLRAEADGFSDAWANAR